MTCDLVNPYHERKEQKKKKKRNKKKKGLRERVVEEQGEAGSGKKQNNPHAAQAKWRGEENKIVQFGGTGREQKQQ